MKLCNTMGFAIAAMIVLQSAAVQAVEILPTWKAVLMTGDDSIRAFDNARKKVKELLVDKGVDPDNIRELSRTTSEQREGVRATSVANLRNAMNELDVGDDGGCFVFMTSHGTRQGFFIRGQNIMSPTEFDAIVDEACGDRPTILLISACYSGVFAEANMQQPNRIILTAARKDRTSFGCSPEATYTYWDTCLIDNLNRSETWQDLQGNLEDCIERKEGRTGYARSYPQARFGATISDYNVF